MQFINGGQLNRTSGLYDLDEDGRKEVLIINGSDRKALLVELKNESFSDTLWSYTLPKGTYFTDVLVIDIDSNGDVYISGWFITKQRGDIGSCYWKNGVFKPLLQMLIQKHLILLYLMERQLPLVGL